MALRFMDDGGDHYTAAQVSQVWTSTQSAIIDANGRRGTNSIHLGFIRNYSIRLGNQPTWICGIAVHQLVASPGGRTLIRLTDLATEQLSLRTNADGTVSVSRNGVTLGTSVATLPVGTYYYIEFKATINNATGAYEVRLNGVNILSGTGADTQNTANASADLITFESPAGTTSYGDDIYICDGTGSTNNDFLGDCRVDAKFPTGAGTTTNLTPSTGANWQCVDDAAPNDDTDYVEHATVDNKDTYAFGDLSHNPVDIFGIATSMRVKKDDAGTKGMCRVIRSGGSEFDGAALALGTSYYLYVEVIEQDPDAVAAWTQTTFNAAEFGMKVKA